MNHTDDKQESQRKKPEEVTPSKTPIKKSDLKPGKDNPKNPKSDE